MGRALLGWVHTTRSEHLPNPFLGVPGPVLDLHGPHPGPGGVDHRGVQSFPGRIHSFPSVGDPALGGLLRRLDAGKRAAVFAHGRIEIHSAIVPTGRDLDDQLTGVAEPMPEAVRS